MAHINKKSFTRNRGTLLVEAAIMIPLILVLTFVLIEGGWLMLKAEQIENAARQGARIASLSGKKSADVTTVVNQIMNDAKFTSWVTTITPAEVLNSSQGTNVTVNVKVAYSDISLTKVTSVFSSYYGGSGPTPTYIGSSVTMTKE